MQGQAGYNDYNNYGYDQQAGYNNYGAVPQATIKSVKRAPKLQSQGLKVSQPTKPLQDRKASKKGCSVKKGGKGSVKKGSVKKGSVKKGKKGSQKQAASNYAQYQQYGESQINIAPLDLGRSPCVCTG